MGICLSAEEKATRKKNYEIDQQLKRDRAQLENEVKLLLLGAGEAGKSTILKQMRLIHDEGYSEEERESYREIIYANTLQSVRVICDAMDKLGIEYSDPKNKALAKMFLESPPQVEPDVVPVDALKNVKQLWQDPGVQKCFRRSNEYQLNDSARYYFESIDRLMQHNYVPTDQDVLRSRVKTTGITESKFKVGNLTYKMFDVGGQRSERKKWIHCFENVTAIIFLVAISAYDQTLVEDETVNRMQEALMLFDNICNSKWFVNTSIILFLNKIDLFREKIKRSPLKRYFPEYSGTDSVEEATEFIKQKFVLLNKSDTKQVYPHLTCATDTNQIRFVMDAVNDIIVRENLRHVGLL